MNKKERQNTVLNDTYFNKPPCLIRLFLIRLVLLCGLSASAVYAVGDLLLFEHGLTQAAIAAGTASAVIFVLASLFPSGIVYFLSLAGFGALFLRDELIEKLTYFFDYLMVRLDSRLLDTERFIIHTTARGTQVEEACILGFSLVGVLIGILFAICCRTRFHGFYVLLIFAAFSAPAFVAEIAGYHISIAIFAAFFLAFYAIRMGYELDGLFNHGSRSEAGEAVRRGEKTYRRRRGFAILGRKLRSDLPRYMKYSSNGVIALFSAGAIAVTMGNVIPQGTTFDYEKMFSDIQEMGADFVSRLEEEWGVDFGSSDAQSEYFSYSQYGDNSGGIGISKPSDSAAPVLDVTLGRNDIPVYLRGDIGVDFSGINWTSVRDEYENVTYLNQNMWEQVKDFYPETMYENTRQRVSVAGYNPDDFLPLQKVSVTYRKRTAVVFQPLAVYAPDYKTNQHFESFGDYILRTRSGENYLNTIESLALTPNMNFKNLENLFGSVMYNSYRSEYEITNSDAIMAYEKYVKGAYLEQKNENIDGLITALYDGGYIADWMLPHHKAQGICDYFRQNFSYSLSVDNGEGAEVLDNFLYNTKQGHCALFATATTLVLRELGVPARYVTGYVVAGEGEAVDGGYKYTLRERDLHAWVEAYVEGIGWLPFDPTAAVDGFDGMAAAGAHEENPPVTSEAVTTTTSAPVTTFSDEGDEVPDLTEEADVTTKPPVSADGTGEGTGDAPADTPEEEKNSLIPVIITILCVIAAIALVIVAVRLFINKLNKAEKKMWTGFRRKKPYAACQQMYTLVMYILEKEDLTPGCELMNDFAVRVDASIFLKGTNVFLVDVMPVFIKCEFGTAELAPVSEEERAAVYKFTAAVYRRYMENKNAVGRFITRIRLFL